MSVGKVTVELEERELVRNATFTAQGRAKFVGGKNQNETLTVQAGAKLDANDFFVIFSSLRLTTIRHLA